MIIQNTEYVIIENEHITIHSFSANMIGKLILCHVNYTCDGEYGGWIEKIKFNSITVSGQLVIHNDSTESYILANEKSINIHGHYSGTFDAYILLLATEWS